MSDEAPIDPLATMIAELDQFLANMGQLARLQKGMFDEYVEAGFSEKQALYLAAAHFRSDGGSSE